MSRIIDYVVDTYNCGYFLDEHYAVTEAAAPVYVKASEAGMEEDYILIADYKNGELKLTDEYKNEELPGVIKEHIDELKEGIANTIDNEVGRSLNADEKYMIQDNWDDYRSYAGSIEYKGSGIETQMKEIYHTEHLRDQINDLIENYELGLNLDYFR